MKRIYIIVSALLCVISCNKESSVPFDVAGSDIRFDVTSDDATRGDNTTSNLGSFRIYSYLTNSGRYDSSAELLFDQECTPNWMNQVKVERISDVWSITGPATANKRFHPSSNHSFFAFAPYDVVNSSYTLEMEDRYDGVASTQSEAGSPVVKYTLPTLASDMVDLLYASHLNASQDDMTPVGDEEATLSLKFRHALSKVTFSVKLEGAIPDDGGVSQSIRIHGLTIANVWNSGKLHFRSGSAANSDTQYYGDNNTFSEPMWYLVDGENVNTPTWEDSEFTDWTLTANALANSGDTYDIIADEKPLYLIPQPLDDLSVDHEWLGTAMADRTLSASDPAVSAPMIMLAYHLVTDGGELSDHSNINGLKFDLKSVATCKQWEPGKAYHYTLTLKADSEAVVVPWAIQVNVVDWIEQHMDVDIYGGEFNLIEGKTKYTMPVGDVLKIPYETTYQYISVVGGVVVDTDPDDKYIEVSAAGNVVVTLSNAPIPNANVPQRVVNITVQ